jgi:hypothetical protein
MADTTFVSGTTVTSAWLNDVNDLVYNDDYFVQSAAEIAAGVTPTHYEYPVGDVRRYGAFGTGDETTELQNAFTVAKNGGVNVILTPKVTYSISSALIWGSEICVHGNNATIIQTTNNIPIITFTDGTSLIYNVRASNLYCTYSSQQSASNTGATGIQLSGANLTVFRVELSFIQVSNAYRGFTVPNLTGCFAFHIKLNACYAADNSDYGFFVQGDTSTGGCTNFVLDNCWIVQTNGAEVATSKGAAFIGVTQLTINTLAADHIQALPALYLLLCTGVVENFTCESAEFAESSGIGSLVLVEGGNIQFGTITQTENTLALSGTADAAILRIASSAQVWVHKLRDLNTAVTDTSSGAYSTILVSGTGNSGYVWRYEASGATPAVLISEPTTVSQVEYFNGTDRTLLVGSDTVNPGNIVDGAAENSGVTVPGAELGDRVVDWSFSLDTQGLILYAYVSAADTVTVRFQNETGGDINLGSGTLRASVRKN